MSNDERDSLRTLAKLVKAGDFMVRWCWANQLGITEAQLLDMIKEEVPKADDIKNRLRMRRLPAPR